MIGALLYHSEQSWRTMQALAEGMSRNGDVAMLCTVDVDDRVDFVATWGARVVVSNKLPHLFLEAGYINGSGPDYVLNRLRFVSCEWNGLGNLADDVGDVPGDRWESLGIDARPWRSPPPGGGRLLVLDQHPSDGAANPHALDAVLAVGSSGWRVSRRPHPLVAKSRPLSEDLESADAAITYGSTASVEAVLWGVPTVVLSPRCVTYPVSVQTVEDLANPMPDRTSWCHKLAYRQWTHDELASGDAWNFLRGKLDVRES